MSLHAHMVAIRGSHRHAAADAKLLGKSDPQQRIKVSIYVRTNPHPPAEALRAVQAMDSQLPRKRKYLSDDDFNAVYGADQADLDKVAAWAKQQKLTVLNSSIPKHQLQVEGTIGDVSKALGIELNEYEHARLGRYRGRQGQVFVPDYSSTSSRACSVSTHGPSAVRDASADTWRRSCGRR